MKSSIKRILSIILALSLIACCFSACGGNEDVEEPTYNIEMPTNPDKGSEDVYVNDGSNNIGNDIGGNDIGGNNVGVNNNTNSYTPPVTNGGSYIPPATYPNVTTPPTTTKPSVSNKLEAEIKHFMTHIDTPEERNDMLALAGYEYDPVQDIYYTHLNPWQREMGFADIYDQAAPLTNMWYLTFKADFSYGDLLWRLQWWKGQYGVLEGAELGVYTKNPANQSSFYKCAEDDQLLKMTMDFYHSWAEYQAGNRLFTRLEQEHWWLTGFKFGMTNPKDCVVRATLYAYNEEMANGIESALQNLTDGNNNLTGKGFVPYVSGVTAKDFYVRNGNRFSIVWQEAGYLNFSTAQKSE
jgi:hypothetical protein